MALVLYQHKVHIGFIAAIVAASNAGGSGSVIGDTTTTMMWIAGKAPFEVLHAYIAAVPAFLFFGYFAAKQQHAYQSIMKDNPVGAHIEWVRLVTVAVILASAVGVNVWFNTHNPEAMNHIPVMGIAVWMAILAMAVVTKPTWSILPNAAKGSVFLLSLVMCASMMPVEKLPVALW
jgi:Na+/H+ antiporter NhaD/arsenite permease-like protein